MRSQMITGLMIVAALWSGTARAQAPPQAAEPAAELEREPEPELEPAQPAPEPEARPRAVSYPSDEEMTSGGRGVMALPGLSLGATLHRAGQQTPSFMIGGELSVVWYDLWSKDWFDVTALGGYADATWHPASRRLRLHVGPQVSSFILGADMAYVVERSPDGWSHGVSARAFVSALVPGMYVRVGGFFGGQPGGYVELGGTLKLPLYRQD